MLEIKEKWHKKTRKQRKKTTKNYLRYKRRFLTSCICLYVYICLYVFFEIYMCRAMEKFKHVFSCAICLLDLNLDF